jgi:hypothetical protein
MPNSIQADNNNITTNLRSRFGVDFKLVDLIEGSNKEQNKELGLNHVVLKVDK